MTSVYYFSGTGHSLAVAAFLADRLGCGLCEISGDPASLPPAETAVVVFPVYCQNIPRPVKAFLKELPSQYAALVATYGRISYGNVLHEAQKLVPGRVIAGACIPMGHTFLDGDCRFEPDTLQPLMDRVCSPKEVRIPKSRKDLLADIFPELRSRMGGRILRNSRCTGCGICEARCPMGAIHNGRTNTKCIRCLRCVTNCPENALRYQNTEILKRYLERRYKDDHVLYL